MWLVGLRVVGFFPVAAWLFVWMLFNCSTPISTLVSLNWAQFSNVGRCSLWDSPLVGVVFHVLCSSDFFRSYWLSRGTLNVSRSPDCGQSSHLAISACYLCVVCFFYCLQVFVNSFAWICLGLVCSLVVVPRSGGPLGVVVVISGLCFSVLDQRILPGCLGFYLVCFCAS